MLKTITSFISSPFDWIGNTFQEKFDSVAKMLHLSPKEKKSVAQNIEQIRENSQNERDGIMSSVLGRGFTGAVDVIKFFAQKNQFTGDISIITEYFFEDKNKKSWVDKFKVAYLIIEKIPFIGSYIERLLPTIPGFMKIADVLDKNIANDIRKGDKEAVSKMVQLILASAEVVNNQLQYAKIHSTTKKKAEISKQGDLERTSVIGSVIDRGKTLFLDFLKSWAQNNQITGDLAIAIEYMTEGKKKQTMIDHVKVIYALYEKVPYFGSFVENLLPKSPYFMKVAIKVDSEMALKIEKKVKEAKDKAVASGKRPSDFTLDKEGQELVSQMVQKIFAQMEIVVNQVRHSSYTK